jgi:hypothetical protein
MLNIGEIANVMDNQHVKQKFAWQLVNLPLETFNAFRNHFLLYASKNPDTVESMRELLELAPGRLKDITEMPKGKGPIIICGSGSSLNDIMPMVKDSKVPIMCSTSQASTLVYNGRTPDYVVCLDPREAPQDELAAPDWGDAVFMAHVSIPYPYVAKWLRRARGPMYFGRIMEPTYQFYSHALGAAYPWIKHIILPMIDSVAEQLMFATGLGYSPIYMCGVDYGGPRMDQWCWDYETKHWEKEKSTSGVDQTKQGQANVEGMNYATRGAMLASFLQIASEKYHQRVYQTSKVTALTQFPYVSPETLFATGGVDNPDTYDAQKVKDELEITLAATDSFLVPCNDGWGVGHQTYLANDEERMAQSMMGYNRTLMENIKHFAEIEKVQGTSVNNMIATGQISIEAGELLQHSKDEFSIWDWKKLGPIDIPAVLMRRRWLLEQAAKRGYIQPK